MVETIGNPLTWAARGLADTADNVVSSVDGIAGEEDVTPRIATLLMQDIGESLRRGYEDFTAARADVMMMIMLYPAIGLVLVSMAFNMSLLPAIFPLGAGFALLGPFAAVGLYEVSRRREMGEDVSWADGLNVIRSRNFGAVLALGLGLAMIYLIWLVSAHTIWLFTLGPVPPVSVMEFTTQVFTTGAGWAMLLVGMAVGFGFALLVLAVAAVSFPMLLDRNVGVVRAVATSIQVFRENKRVVLAWGFTVAALLVLGSIPMFLGLIVVLPILGHGTWHLYRTAVRF